MKTIRALLHFGVLALLISGDGKAAEKMPGAGIMYLCDDSPELQGQPDHFSCAAANGLSFRTAWMGMEPREGQYDWSHVDAMVAAAAAAHKPMGLGITAGFRCPRWILSSDQIQMITGSLIRSFAATRTMTMPVPWDTVYQQKWGSFLDAVGKRYDNNPNVAYIVMAGMGHAFEPGMARAPEDVEKFNSMGGLTAWLSGSEKIVDLYAHAFPHTPFIFAVNKPIPSPDAIETAKMLAEYGLQKYPGHFGVMFDGLDGTESPASSLISGNSATTTVGYQMVWSTTGVNAHWLKGSLQDCLEAGINDKAHFIEVYGTDCDDPQYTAGLQQAGTQLKAIVSGGK